jgi:hypothetical protein
MFRVEIDLRLGARGTSLSDDEITDMIERLVDDLDEQGSEPDIGTVRAGDDVDMTIAVIVDEDDDFAALQAGAAIVGASLQRAGIARADLLSGDGHRLRTSVQFLQPA